MGEASAMVSGYRCMNPAVSSSHWPTSGVPVERLDFLPGRALIRTPPSRSIQSTLTSKAVVLEFGAWRKWTPHREQKECAPASSLTVEDCNEGWEG